MANIANSLKLLGALQLGSVLADGDSLSLVQTMEASADRLTAKPDVPFGDDFPSQIVLDVSSTDIDQEIIGFGGAFTEASAVNFQGLPASQQDELLEKYFDPEKGIGYTLGRVHINSCDFSVAPAEWSEDDTPGDFDLVNFDTNLTHDSDAMIPFIKKSMAKLEAAGRKLQLFASPWSPPAWMKDNNNMTNGGRLKDDSKQVWANYIAKWIQSYKDKGVPLWGLTPQNEPENAARWEACLYTAQEEADWVGQYLGPAVKTAHPEVLIFPFDHNKDHVHEWAQTFFNHPTASKYVDGIAFHWYTGDSFDNVAKVHAEFPDKILLPTEATWEMYRGQGGAWYMGQGYAHDILGDLENGAVGWTDWNLLLDETGGPNHVGNNCDAPVFADSKTKELTYHPQYYFIGHFSKFLVPGSKRIKSTVTGSTSYTGWGRPYGECDESDGLQATTFQRPDGQIAIVALNCGNSTLDFKIKDNSRAAKASIPAKSIQTYLFKRQGKQEAASIVV